MASEQLRGVGWLYRQIIGRDGVDREDATVDPPSPPLGGCRYRMARPRYFPPVRARLVDLARPARRRLERDYSHCDVGGDHVPREVVADLEDDVDTQVDE